ncbi:MAG: alanine--glyoxylate aminotransferase family protein [Synechococcaceae cyanobacterium SM2_3_2]|nr:alanine--glyoxylate aminotransferase family protein [Synechococcaceae cyanobacterium SM2_3_2]
MKDKLMLMLPGPTPVPESALLALARAPMGHRSKDFTAILEEVSENLRWLHQTHSDVLIFSASGTGAMEAGLVNVLSPGDRVLCGVNGKFGERWADMADTFGLQCERVETEWGVPYDVDTFRSKLEADTEKTIKAVILTHSETSTGVANDIESIAKSVKAHGEALTIVDGVTSIGAMPVKMDEWGLDIVASGSQKGYMIPPGLGFTAVSERAMHVAKQAKLPKFYWSFDLAKKNLAKGTTPFTPAVNMIYALQVSLAMMKAEGLEAIFSRHAQLSAATIAGVKALGLKLLVQPESAASPAVTAVWSPEGIDADKVRGVLSKQFDIVTAAGQDHLKGKIFRIGHLGFISPRDVLMTMATLESALNTVGYTDFTAGSAVKAAADVLANA